MLKIGDFSKLSRVSVRMLRHYDDIGLLKPAQIDEITGYRYYHEEQLFVIGRITALKDMGFALADIIKMLAVYDDKDKIDEFLIKKQGELEQEAKQTEYKLMLLASARKRLRKEQIMNYDVNVKTIPERYAATVQMVIPRYEDEGKLWNMLGECKTPLVPADPCLAAAVFMDKEYKEENVEVMIWMTVKGIYEDTEHVKFQTLPAVKVASYILKGSYEGINDATAIVVSWMKDNGYTVSGPMFNIYHVGPAQTQNPDEFVTEICFPIAQDSLELYTGNGIEFFFKKIEVEVEEAIMAFDFKKEYKEFYMPKNKPEIVNVPEANYIAVRGKGNPNEEGGAYQQAISVLYAVAYTIKMSYKTDYKIKGFFEYVVPPLEGFWWQDDAEGVDYSDKSTFNWISVIRLPDFVTKADFEWAVETATKKKKIDCSSAEYLTIEEGLCVQIMHLGSFDDEPATVALMDDYLEQNGYVNDMNKNRLHHEIYMSDARKVIPEKWKTVIRHPIKKV